MPALVDFPLFTFACCLLINPLCLLKASESKPSSSNILTSSATQTCAVVVSCVSLSSLQNEVRVTVHVDPKAGTQHLYRVVLRFTNPGSASVTGSIKATNNRGTEGKAASHIESAPTCHQL